MSFEQVYKIAGRWFFQNTFGWRLYDLPPPDTYEAFTKATLICTKGDGVITPEEREWVIGFCATRGMPPSLVEEMKTYEATDDIAEVVARTPHSIKAKRATIYYAIKACLADGDYHKGEQTAVREMSNAIGISKDEVEQFEAMCLEEQRLLERRVELLFPDGLPYSTR